MTALPLGRAGGEGDQLVTSLHGIFGHRLRSVVAYGLDTSDTLSCLALVHSLTMADLEACADRAQGWKRHGIATPLILPEEEFRRSLDAFPLEYAEIIRAHTVLFGASPFDGTAIDRADLRRACEAQIKSHLVHLREGFIEAAGVPRAIADLVRASAPAFAALLRHIAQLNGATATDRATATREGARAAQLPDRVVSDIVGLEQSSGVRATDAARLYPEYLAAVEQLARYIDGWNV